MKNIEKYRHMRPVEYGYHLKGVGGTLKLPPPLASRRSVSFLRWDIYIFVTRGKFQLDG